jgi:hypothetical protein
MTMTHGTNAKVQNLKIHPLLDARQGKHSKNRFRIQLGQICFTLTRVSLRQRGKTQQFLRFNPWQI